MPVPKSPPSSSRNQLTEARRASSGPGQTPRHCGRPHTGRAGPRQKVLAALPAPGRTNAVPGIDPDTHTHPYPSGTLVMPEGSIEEAGGILAPALHGLELRERLSQREPQAVVGKWDRWDNMGHSL